MTLLKLSFTLSTAFILGSGATGCVHQDSPAGRAAEDTKKALRKAGDKTAETTDKASAEFKRAAKKTGDAISEAVDDVRDATNTNVKKEEDGDE